MSWIFSENTIRATNSASDRCAMHLTGGGMSKDMRAPPPALNAGTSQGDLCNVFNRASRPAPSERPKGSHRAQEDLVAFDSWTPDSHVLQQGIPYILWKWQLDLATSFSRNRNASCPEADIAQAQSRHVASA